MSLKFEIGLDAIRSYRRLNYTPWHALAEFVDNSTQAYFDHKEDLDKLYKNEDESLEVNVIYERKNDILRISDNSSGMDDSVLKRALHVAMPPENPNGRSRYGMGMKTSACWLGDVWTIKTKKYGFEDELFVTIDVEKIASGNPDINPKITKIANIDKHYTIIEIHKLRRQFHSATLKKMKDFLRSMYRQDFREKKLKLYWNAEQLNWDEIDEELLTAADGKRYKQDFIFDVNGRIAFGWAGVLAKGSRAKAGFSILHKNRVIRGWPDSWRPSSLYGQLQGSNDLINQRLIGEIHLDDFEVTHTKDDINWFGNEEDLVEEGLKKEVGAYREIAKEYRKEENDPRGPSEIEEQTALKELEEELKSPPILDAVKLDVTPAPEIISRTYKEVIEQEKLGAETLRILIEEIDVKVYINSDRSPNDPYFVSDSTTRNDVCVVVNKAHPHWKQLKGSEGVLNYLRHCVYDALSEHQARHKKGNLQPDTVKSYKDRFLRIPFEIESI